MSAADDAPEEYRDAPTPDVPPLDDHEGSWVLIVDGRPIFETYYADVAQRFLDLRLGTVMTIGKWLASLNDEIAKSKEKDLT